MQTLSRRSLLRAGAAGAVASLAGCSALGSDDESDGDGESDEANDGDDENERPRATVIARADQEAATSLQQEAQASQQELQQQLQAGELNQSEFEAQLQQVRSDTQESQRQLLNESVQSIGTHADETDGISVIDSLPERGVLLVEGDSESLFQLLQREDVRALLDEEQFQQLQQTSPGL